MTCARRCPGPRIPRALRGALPGAVAVAAAGAFAPVAAGQCLEGCLAIHTLVGEAAGDQFGWVSDPVGDVDGDGVPDFLLTAPNSGADLGRIYVYSGASGAELWRATGPVVGGWLGFDATGAGDVDGLGRPDVIAGAPNNGAGRAIVYSSEGNGAVIHQFLGAIAGDKFGHMVGGDGDFDGDGTPDLIIGAIGHDAGGNGAGRAYIYSGATFALIAAIDGDAPGEALGSAVDFIGDVDGDGRDDALIGVPNGGNGLGEAQVVAWDGKAARVLYTVTPTGPASNFGLWFLSGGGDIDGDGVPDFYVGDYQANRAHVYSGADGALLWQLLGNGNGQFGIGRLIEDVDGDCSADLLLAAWASNAGAPGAGKAFVYSGRDGSVLDTYTHSIAGAGFGFDLNGLGDVNGDGASDHVITAAADLGGRGRAYVIAGEIAPPAAGDLGGDGRASFDDVVQLLAGWGPCAGWPASCPTDLDCSGETGFSDLLLILTNWS